MTTIDISALSPQERIDLIGELWDSLEVEQSPLTEAQKSELDHRLGTLDQDIGHGRSADEIIAELEQRFR